MFVETLFDLIVGWNDAPSPRIVVEIDNVKRITDEEVRHQYETQDGYTWLATVREMGKSHFSGKQQGLVVLEIPLQTTKL